jgi:plasmid stability protein
MTEEPKPTGITHEDAIEAARHSRSVDFEGREVQVAGLNIKSAINERNSARITLDLGDEYLVLVGHFWGNEFMEEGRERHTKE